MHAKSALMIVLADFMDQLKHQLSFSKALIGLSMVFWVLSCIATKEKLKASIETLPFGTLTDGEKVKFYILTNATGVEMKVTNYGGIINALRVPDRYGQLEDIVLGYDSLP